MKFLAECALDGTRLFEAEGISGEVLTADKVTKVYSTKMSQAPVNGDQAICDSDEHPLPDGRIPDGAVKFIILEEEHA